MLLTPVSLVLGGLLASAASNPQMERRQSAAATTASSPTPTSGGLIQTTPQVQANGQTIPALSEITANAPVQSANSITSTVTSGQPAPTQITGAPANPGFVYTPGTYPDLDVVPDVNSTEVQQWLSEIDLSNVPDLSITDGTCSGSATAAADASRCWWTCGGCTRDTDVTTCPDPLTFGISYDDGPSPYTPLVLDYLNAVNVSATFFVVGSRVISRPDMLALEYQTGHQISVHTWSHPPLTTLTNAQIVAELGWTKKAIKDVTGVTPNTMRPPYGDIDDRVRAVCKAMGLTPILWTNSNGVEFDTDDWKIPGGTATGESSIAAFDKILATASDMDTGFIVLEHDLYQQTVDLAVGYLLPSVLNSTNPKFNLMSIIDCHHQPLRDAYIETSTNLTTPTSNSSGVSTSSSSSSILGHSTAVSASSASSGKHSGSASASASASAGSKSNATKSSAERVVFYQVGSLALTAGVVGGLMASLMM